MKNILSKTELQSQLDYNAKIEQYIRDIVKALPHVNHPDSDPDQLITACLAMALHVGQNAYHGEYENSNDGLVEFVSKYFTGALGQQEAENFFFER